MELRPGYKQTDIGPIPEDWNVSTVGLEFSIQLGKMLDAEKNLGVSKPFLGNRAVQWGRFDLTDLGEIRLTPSDLKSFRLYDGDLLVCEGGEIGRAAIWNSPIPECYYQKALHRLRPIRKYDVRFMRYLLERLSSTGFLLNFAAQTSIAHLPKDKFETVPIPLPATSEEQTSIAEALSDAGALIESLEQLLAKRRQIKQGAMQELLTGKKRLPGFKGKWAEKQLKFAIASLEAGVSVNSVEGLADLESGAIAVLKTSCVNHGVFTPNECKRIAAKDIGRARLSPQANTILISRMNTIDLVGECGYVASDYPQLFIPDRLWMTRFHKNIEVSARWLSYVLSSDYYRMALKELATGTSGSMKNLSKDSLLSLEVSFPSPPEQKAIASVLSDMDAEIAALKTKLAKARQIKQGMMQELLTGRIRLVQPSAEVVPFPVKQSVSAATNANHNPQINEAVILAVLAHRFGSEQFPLGRFRRTKLSYLLHRHTERQVAGFMKKAAGPYNPHTRYGGAEKIALKNGYVSIHKTAKGEGFIAANNIAQAEGYFESWYSLQVLDWLKQFHYKKNEELELLTTVDMAIEDLRREGNGVTVAAVKQIIHESPEWKAKLDRATFADSNIAAAIESCRQLFPVEE